MVVSGLAYAKHGLLAYVMPRLGHDLPAFAAGAAAGALLGALLAGGWGVRRRWVVAVAASLGAGYLMVWVVGIVSGLSG